MLLSVHLVLPFFQINRKRIAVEYSSSAAPLIYSLPPMLAFFHFIESRKLALAINPQHPLFSLPPVLFLPVLPKGWDFFRFNPHVPFPREDPNLMYSLITFTDVCNEIVLLLDLWTQQRKEGGDKLREWHWRIYTTMCKQTASGKLLFSTGNSAQCSVTT